MYVWMYFVCMLCIYVSMLCVCMQESILNECMYVCVHACMHAFMYVHRINAISYAERGQQGGCISTKITIFNRLPSLYPSPTPLPNLSLPPLLSDKCHHWLTNECFCSGRRKDGGWYYTTASATSLLIAVLNIIPQHLCCDVKHNSATSLLRC